MFGDNVRVAAHDKRNTVTACVPVSAVIGSDGGRVCAVGDRLMAYLDRLTSIGGIMGHVAGYTGPV